jgi:hypothetical protein
VGGRWGESVARAVANEVKDGGTEWREYREEDKTFAKECFCKVALRQRTAPLFAVARPEKLLADLAEEGVEGCYRCYS